MIFVVYDVQLFDTSFELNYQRLPSNEEATERVEMLVRRRMEIESKIKILMNR